MSSSRPYRRLMDQRDFVYPNRAATNRVPCAATAGRPGGVRLRARLRVRLRPDYYLPLSGWGTHYRGLSVSAKGFGANERSDFVSAGSSATSSGPHGGLERDGAEPDLCAQPPVHWALPWPSRRAVLCVRKTLRQQKKTTTTKTQRCRLYLS